MCPARGTAGHSFAGSGNYTLPTTQDLSWGQPDWRWCNRCQGLWYSANGTFGACPAGPGGHHWDPYASDYAPDVNSGSGQGQWRWCRQCQGMWFGANGTGGVCPLPGTAGHSLSGSGNYHLDVWN